ncbi:hypothetical protein KFL_004170020 [Klebsormidium nitens]|uniref:Uncharacterized protein n=1 Tax=Klebsormidium nitens TaxID=105231 RepID=A0A1Y1IBF3_KLENI|nr:hypothetical protein KFL_004170020 [Klebsormidium nitens]|eukprot:GAQ88304.1 hypothetical protein KFL_004170020 [Klebsormidium nitens]
MEALLAKARKKLKEVRQYVRSPALVRDADQARNQLWCIFCDEDVIAGSSTFACENPIKHLANQSHVEQVRLFLLANLLDRSRLDDFTILEKDFLKWETQSAKLLPPPRPSPGNPPKPPHPHVSSAPAPRSLQEWLCTRGHWWPTTEQEGLLPGLSATPDCPVPLILLGDAHACRERAGFRRPRFRWAFADLSFAELTGNSSKAGRIIEN